MSISPDVLRAYQGGYTSNESSPWRELGAKPKAEHVMRLINDSGLHDKLRNLIDVGCGDGSVMMQYSVLGIPMTGIEISQNAVKLL